MGSCLFELFVEIVFPMIGSAILLPLMIIIAFPFVLVRAMFHPRKFAQSFDQDIQPIIGYWRQNFGSA